jgi:hypothetical protein
MRQYFPSIMGVPICFWEGDEVKTRDGGQYQYRCTGRTNIVSGL